MKWVEIYLKNGQVYVFVENSHIRSFGYKYSNWFPNSTTAFLWFQNNTENHSLNEAWIYEIFNEVGKSAESRMYHAGEAIDLRTLKKGIYFGRGPVDQVQKIVKK